MRHKAGVLPYQCLQQAAHEGWISSPTAPLESRQFQAASLDLRLGSVAYRMRSSFLPGDDLVRTKLDALALYDLELAPSAVLEPGHVYLIPLLEALHLPRQVRGRANPKSSTARLDIFTRVITDSQPCFDDISPGYVGPLYVEVFSRSFTIKVHCGLSLNQVRLMVGDGSLDDPALQALHDHTPLLYDNRHNPIPPKSVHVQDGLYLSLETLAGADGVVGYKAKPNSGLIDLARVGAYDPSAFFEPIGRTRGSLILEPEAFYLLASKEKVCIPAAFAAELLAYDAGMGEMRTHYAGFFDPGFGQQGQHPGSPAVLEVRAHDVPFLVEDGQRFCKLRVQKTLETPQVTYGMGLDSHYQSGQRLAKQFIPWQWGESRL